MREGTSGLLIEKASSRLSQYMFKDDEQSAEKSKKIANRLGNYKTHKHPISIKETVNKCLKVKPPEQDWKLQDKILSVFHATTVIFAATACIKIIGNHNV